MSARFETKSSHSQKSNRHQPHPGQVASIEAIQQSLVENFGDIKDPRVERTKKHQLTDILVIAILALKANHPTLYHQVEQWFETAAAQDFQGIDVSYDHRIEKGHHPTEIRSCWSVPISALGELYQPKIWAGLQSVVMIVRERRLWNKTTREVQFYLSSLHSDAQLLGRAIRKHWGIENQAHWILDCTFAEDSCRIHSFHSPRNFALLRRIALNALNREQTYKRSLRQKMKRTGMDNDYMIQVLSSCFIDSTLDSSQSLCQA